MSSPFAPRCVPLFVVWLVLLAVIQRPSPARETFGSWSTAEKAEEAITFFKRMKAEFAARAQRLSQEGGKAVDVTMPFVDGIESQDEKVAADWIKFTSGKMGEANTARWSAKGLKELESMRKKLATAEKPAVAGWDKKHKDGRQKVELPPEAEAFIYEMSVTARKLGVILDNSPSMREVLPLVRAEITRRFAGARFLEVNASSLEMPNPKWGPYGEWYYCTMLEERNPFDAKWFLPAIPQEDIHYHMIGWKRDTFAAMRSLVTLMEVDAVYWFCDFEDEIEPAAVRALSEVLKKGGARLYIHSVKNSPPGALMTLVRETNGKTTRAVPGKATDGPAPPPAAGNPVTPAAPAAGEPNLISKEFLLANAGKTVRITGVIGSHGVYQNYGTVALSVSPVEGLVSIDFPDKAFKPTTSKASLIAQYPVGRVFEATGLLQPPRSKASPGVWMTPNLKLRALTDFKLLPAGTPAPVAKPGDAPAKPKARAPVDPFRYKQIKPIPLDYKSNVEKPVSVTVKVKMVLTAPKEQVVTIHLEGTNLLLYYKGDGFADAVPAGVGQGTTVTAYGELMKTLPNAPPVLKLDSLQAGATR